MGTKSVESRARNLEAESIGSRAESTGDCIKLKTVTTTISNSTTTTTTTTTTRLLILLQLPLPLLLLLLLVYCYYHYHHYHHRRMSGPSLLQGWESVNPVLNWANVCSPEHTSDTSTNYNSFLNWTFSSPNMVRTVQTLFHSHLACNEMQASARTCGRRAADSMIENVG